MMLLSILLAPVIATLLAAAAPRREQAQRIALGAALSVLGLGLACAAQVLRSGGAMLALAPDLGSLGRAPLLELDGLSLLWVIAAALIASTVLAATPRRMLARGNIVATLATLAATEGLLLSRNVVLMAAFWVLALVPGAVLVLRASDRSHARTYGVLAIGASAPMMAAAVSLARIGQRHGLAAPLDLGALAALEIPVREQALPLVLVLASVAIRLGLFPFHAWLPPLAQRGPVGAVGLLVGVHTGLFVLAEALQILPDASAAAMPYVAGGALLACVWGAVLALVQTDLARMLGFIACSKAGMLVVGVASLETTSLHGAFLKSIGGSIAWVGLLVIVRSVEARWGTRDVRRLGGLVSHMPRASASFFVLTAATIGFPGSLAFVGEDLLVHGVLHAHPLAATALLVAAALNGITLFRAFCRAFLGRPVARSRIAAPPAVDDLGPRERIATSALILLLLVFGLAPGTLLAARRAQVDRLMGSIHREPAAASFRHEGGPAPAR